MKKKIAIIGTAGIPARYGGFETLANELVNNLPEDFDLTVYCSSRIYTRKERRNSDKKVNHVYIPLRPNGYQSILYDLYSLVHALFNSDVLLILGISGVIFLPLIRILSNRRIIVHVDGQEWNRSRWNTIIKSFLKLSERIAVICAHSVITDHPVIESYIRNTYNKSSSMIGYGGDHVFTVENDESDQELSSYMKLITENKDPGYAISVGRIVPENNYNIILEAYSELPGKRIILIGNWQSSRYGRKLKIKFQQYENMILLDPVYNQKHLNLLRSNASVYLHGHSCGGTNPSLVEAMFLGLPVIAHNNPFNLSTTENQAFYFSDENEIVKILGSNSQKDFESCGKRLQSVAQEKMKWAEVARKYTELFLSK